MFARRLWLLAVCLGFVGFGQVQAQAVKTEPGFKRLDTGKDLEGWTGNTQGWSVTEGAIHLDSKKAKGNIYSKTPHSKNVVIRMQFRATPGADSGVFVYGKQLQVRDYPKAGPKQYAAPAKPAGQWNDLEFDITDGVAVVKLNGQVIEKAWKIGNNAKQGVGLQKERGDFDFRDIRMKEKK
jgi:3-keto-disaccharide hydrolase